MLKVFVFLQLLVLVVYQLESFEDDAHLFALLGDEVLVASIEEVPLLVRHVLLLLSAFLSLC